MEDIKFKKECEQKLASILKSTCKDCGGDYKECVSSIPFSDLPMGEFLDEWIYEEDVPEGSEFVGKVARVIKIANDKIRIKDTDLIIDYKSTASVCYCKNTKKYS